MNKGFRIIGGCLLTGTGITVMSLNHEWYYVVIGFVMVVVGNFLAIETRGNKNEFN